MLFLGENYSINIVRMQQCCKNKDIRKNQAKKMNK